MKILLILHSGFEMLYRYMFKDFKGRCDVEFIKIVSWFIGVFSCSTIYFIQKNKLKMFRPYLGTTLHIATLCELCSNICLFPPLEFNPNEFSRLSIFQSEAVHFLPVRPFWMFFIQGTIFMFHIGPEGGQWSTKEPGNKSFLLDVLDCACWF